MAAELEVAKAAATSGVKAGAAAIRAAQSQFEVLQGQLSRAMACGGKIGERPSADDQDELRLLRSDVQHLQLEVEHGDSQLATRTAEAARLKLELRNARSDTRDA